MRRHLAGQMRETNVKPQHWCGVSGIFALKAAPVLGFTKYSIDGLRNLRGDVVRRKYYLTCPRISPPGNVVVCAFT
jgi:hypothetical protein